ncbi:MAG: glycosyltransferase family 39 protein [Xanthomonadaceae bacterium]|nr:glycosyltransferase family 39 protein [Xanthomonadaceae bacterium]
MTQHTDSASTRDRRTFIALWVCVLLAKCVLAARLPLFVDEAFYWQESRHPAWAYSDLPGFTAWLVRAGQTVAGSSEFALRWPFLLIAALLPWWIVRIARRELGADHAWQAGSLAVVLPLLGTLGVLGLPDVPLALATVLCLDAGTRLLRGVDWTSTGLLAAGLVIGGLTHYRFVAVIGVGFLALLWLREGRIALRDPRTWVAVGVGALAWWPLLSWNLANADAGLRFQLVERHPWAFHPDGAQFLLVQAVFASPLLLIALLRGGAAGLRADRAAAVRYLALSGIAVFAGFFLLGFFADSERVSFHWPLPAYLALLPLAAPVIAAWRPALRRCTWGLAGIGLVAGLGYYAIAASPTLRERLAEGKAYPSNFAGWDALAETVVAERAAMPAGTRLLADNFKIGAELGFALGDPRIPVLDHPLNAHHGRAPQLALWQLRVTDRSTLGEVPVLLLVGASDVEYRQLLRRYHDLCTMVGPLPAPKVLNIDHGRQRFLLFRLPPRRATSPCTTPAMAWIDLPANDGPVPRRFELRGWAFKDGVGLAKVEALVDGEVVSRPVYGIARPEVVGFWSKWRDGGSSDPQQPNVGFDVWIDLGERPPGRYRLGLRLHGRDGSVEDWPSRVIELR